MKIVRIFWLFTLLTPCLAEGTIPDFPRFSGEKDADFITLRTDKSFYFQGEMTFFMAIVNNWTDTTLSCNSVAVFLTSQNKEIVYQGQFPLKKGVCSGSFKIPYGLKEGFYNLFLLTGNPENGSVFYYQQLFPVLNFFPANSGNTNYTLEGPDNKPSRISEKISSNNSSESDNPGILLSEINFLPPDSATIILNFHDELIACKNSRIHISIADSASVFAFPFHSLSELTGQLIEEDLKVNPFGVVYKTGSIKTGLIPEEKILRINMTGNAFPFEFRAWVNHTNSNFNGDLLITLPGPLPSIQREYATGKDFIIVQLPSDKMPLDICIQVDDQNRFSFPDIKPFQYSDLLNDIALIGTSQNADQYLGYLKEVHARRIEILAAYQLWNEDLNEVYDTLQRKADSSINIPFYGKPDSRFFPFEYELNQDLESLIKYHIPEIRLKKSMGESYLQFNPVYRSEIKSKSRPWILLNGIPQINVNEILSIPGKNIEYIDICLNNFVSGNNFYPGLINIIPKNEVDKNLLPFLKTCHIDLKGFEDSCIYKYRHKRGNPDIRTILYWGETLPDAKNRFKQNFKCPDVSGTYCIRLLIIPENGKLYEEIRYFKMN